MTFHKISEEAIMKYNDMIIEAFDFERKLVPGKIWQASFKVRVLSSPKGEMSQEQAVPVQYDDGQLQATLQKLESSDLDQAGLVALGRALAAVLLPPGPEGALTSARELLKANLQGLGPDEGLRLRLRLPPMLAPLPWEYIYVDRAGGGDGMDGFLALDPRVAILRHEVMAAPVVLEQLGGDIKIVAALAIWNRSALTWKRRLRARPGSSPSSLRTLPSTSYRPPCRARGSFTLRGMAPLHAR
jgi:hypothetical protein